MHDLSQHYLGINQQISDYCRQYERNPAEVRLVAVGKRHPVEKILALNALGQRHFAENYLQEAESKITACNQSDIVWHFIGHIQSRKCKQIAELFDWVHTVASIKVATKLQQHRKTQVETQNKAPLNVLIQLNLQHEQSKSGIAESELQELSHFIVEQCPHLRLCGLMIIPENVENFEQQRAVFRHCRKLLSSIQSYALDAKELSMGMSGDLEAAIAEGATQVRIGTALFGQRPALNLKMLIRITST